MTYLIAQPRIDLGERACVRECPAGTTNNEDDLPHPLPPYLAENALPRESGLALE